MSARTKARKRAVDILYSADIRQVHPDEMLHAAAERAKSEPDREASWLYAREIIDGVIEQIDPIDDLIIQYSKGWAIDRMPAVDRAILRMSIWELMFNDEIPEPVAISEAVELATELSTEDSPVFINGLLAAIAKTKGD